jgi:hypothetical protein
VILRSNGSLGMRQTPPPNALRAKGVEEEEEEEVTKMYRSKEVLS